MIFIPVKIMDVGIIIGESPPLTWNRWRHLAKAVERLGFDSLFRSDHYFVGAQKDAIDVFLSFVMAAEETSHIRFGPLVTPVTFREPVNVGRMAQQLDDLSDGRFVLGLGAGWFVEEHEVYGVDLPPVGERYDRLDEAIELMQQLWYSDDGRYSGRHYRLAGTDSRPHPPAGRPALLIGGSGPRRTLRIAAEHAHEWNTTPLDVAGYRRATEALDRHCDDVGRDPGAIRRSMLLFAAIGPDAASAARVQESYLTMISPGGRGMSLAQAEADGRAPWRGSVEELVDHVARLAELGVAEVVFDHLCHDDDEWLEWLAADVAPALRAL